MDASTYHVVSAMLSGILVVLAIVQFTNRKKR